MKSLPVIECSGTHYEMGKIQGEFFKKYRSDFLKILLKSDLSPPWLKKVSSSWLFSVLGLIAGKKKSFKTHAPNQWERIKGISKTSLMEVGSFLAIAELESRPNVRGSSIGCSTLSFSPEKVNDGGGVLLGYNHDFLPTLEPFLLVRQSKPQKGLKHICLTYSPMPGTVVGVNEAGFAVAANHVHAMDARSKGLPPSIIVQEALESAHDVSEAIKIIMSLPCDGGSILTIADRFGAMACIELSRTRHHIRPAMQGCLLSVNQYESKIMQEVEIPEDALYHPTKSPPELRGLLIHGVNWARKERFSELLNTDSVMNEKDLILILQDHDCDMPSRYSICRHSSVVKTLATVIVRPKSCMMKIGWGSPCESNFITYGL